MWARARARVCVCPRARLYGCAAWLFLSRARTISLFFCVCVRARARARVCINLEVTTPKGCAPDMCGCGSAAPSARQASHLQRPAATRARESTREKRGEGRRVTARSGARLNSNRSGARLCCRYSARCALAACHHRRRHQRDHTGQTRQTRHASRVCVLPGSAHKRLKLKRCAFMSGGDFFLSIKNEYKRREPVSSHITQFTLRR